MKTVFLRAARGAGQGASALADRSIEPQRRHAGRTLTSIRELSRGSRFALRVLGQRRRSSSCLCSLAPLRLDGRSATSSGLADIGRLPLRAAVAGKPSRTGSAGAWQRLAKGGEFSPLLLRPSPGGRSGGSTAREIEDVSEATADWRRSIGARIADTDSTSGPGLTWPRRTQERLRSRLVAAGVRLRRQGPVRLRR